MRGAVGLLAHEHASYRRSRLEPRRGIHHVAHDERGTLRRGIELDDSLARVHAHAHAELGARQFFVQRRDGDRDLRAARTARSASSPRATGAPKTAITASPMNFSTVPPKRSISTLTHW